MLVPRVVCRAPPLITRPVPVRSVKASPFMVKVSPVWTVRLPLKVARPVKVLAPVTPRVLDKVVAPVTPRVVPTARLPVNVKPVN